jgi:hypothetical protein
MIEGTPPRQLPELAHPGDPCKKATRMQSPKTAAWATSFSARTLPLPIVRRPRTRNSSHLKSFHEKAVVVESGVDGVDRIAPPTFVMVKLVLLAPQQSI